MKRPPKSPRVTLEAGQLTSLLVEEQADLLTQTTDRVASATKNPLDSYDGARLNVTRTGGKKVSFKDADMNRAEASGLFELAKKALYQLAKRYDTTSPETNARCLKILNDMTICSDCLLRVGSGDDRARVGDFWEAVLTYRDVKGLSKNRDSIQSMIEKSRAPEHSLSQDPQLFLTGIHVGLDAAAAQFRAQGDFEQRSSVVAAFDQASILFRTASSEQRVDAFKELVMRARELASDENEAPKRQASLKVIAGMDFKDAVSYKLLEPAEAKQIKSVMQDMKGREVAADWERERPAYSRTPSPPAEAARSRSPSPPPAEPASPPRSLGVFGALKGAFSSVVGRAAEVLGKKDQDSSDSSRPKSPK